MTEANGLGTVLFEPVNPVVEYVGPNCAAGSKVLTLRYSIVFVHGLGGDRVRTWTFAPGTPEALFCPETLLPRVCPQSRILSFGYNAAFAHFYPSNDPRNAPVGTTIDAHSTSLFQALIGLRSKTKSVNLVIMSDVNQADDVARMIGQPFSWHIA